jgi:hypothetical protein
MFTNIALQAANSSYRVVEGGEVKNRPVRDLGKRSTQISALRADGRRIVK